MWVCLLCFNKINMDRDQIGGLYLWKEIIIKIGSGFTLCNLSLLYKLIAYIKGLVYM